MFDVRFKSHHDASRNLKKFFDTHENKEEYVKEKLHILLQNGTCI